MSIAALPNYLMHDFRELTPGQRFGMFFPVWSANWLKDDGAKTEALKKVTADFLTFKPLVSSLIKRQESMATGRADVFTLPAVSTSPFMTGTGMEHPLENGFAFLQPYGMPYLPGSSIKGVLRRTAELLAAGEFNGEKHGWDTPAIEALFGPEPKQDEDTSRGALLFWDVIIEPKDYKLGMDILTPHFGDYYFGKSTPHESGQPIPNPFLVVPPGAKFQFHIQCNVALIKDEQIRSNWCKLVQTALEHAFDWLGFGAKTAVGYGAMQEDQEKKAEREALEQKQQEAARRGSMSQDDLAYEDHLPVIQQFRRDFDEAKKSTYQAGGTFDSKRNDFIGKAKGWEDQRSRTEAASLLEETLTWGMPGKKESKQRLKDAVAALQDPLVGMPS